MQNRRIRRGSLKCSEDFLSKIIVLSTMMFQIQHNYWNFLVRYLLLKYLHISNKNFISLPVQFSLNFPTRTSSTAHIWIISTMIWRTEQRALAFSDVIWSRAESCVQSLKLNPAIVWTGEIYVWDRIRNPIWIESISYEWGLIVSCAIRYFTYRTVACFVIWIMGINWINNVKVMTPVDCGTQVKLVVLS